MFYLLARPAAGTRNLRIDLLLGRLLGIAPELPRPARYYYKHDDGDPSAACTITILTTALALQPTRGREDRTKRVPDRLPRLLEHYLRIYYYNRTSRSRILKHHLAPT
ncbi:hypothetical protein AMTR_s00079p00175520 [Amborella trichopoda]|uniref:Uncharacterized protein n=1 Tax=Amborella trichopoda TaxID=13333 RepID=W1P8U6_AMBTC|nr:hypothetical protein AMTR_s00079p00175520 [Amborella trichopoda]